ncbi:MFS transporter [Brachybacterium sp. EF45031]|uniref:MFS transporter n=1 Tax=Brachybacterium sillae TaxID=2810536 RepID=UPI00217DDA4A|nr:MFS transporter [Brachybacterium sillae]MCS6711702.1 MFS transporter [Brachybacterium sillae]
MTLAPDRHAPTPSTPSRTERLESLPFTRRHARLLGTSGIGWALDAMDVGLVSFLMAALAVHWDLGLEERSLLASAGFVGMAIGAVVGGALADRYGRRHVFTLTLLVYGLATGASALATSFAVLVALRIIVGLGLGAELPVASTLVSEFAPRRIRGRMVVWLEAFWAVGWILAAIIGATVVAQGPSGWRWALALGCLPAFYAIVVRWGMPESVRFLERRGRHEEAERTVRGFEQSPAVMGARPGAVDDHSSATPTATGPGQTVRTAVDRGASDRHASDREHPGAAPSDPASVRPGLWSPQLRYRTAALWSAWFLLNLAYYGAFIWIPSLLVEQGFDLTRSVEFTLVMTLAQLPGYAVSAWLIERIGRRWTLGAFLLGSAGAALVYGTSGEAWQIVVVGCVLSFFALGAWGALYAISPEIYPTAVRASGSGAAAGFGRLASIVAPLLVPVLLAAGGVGLVFAVIAASFVLAAVAAFQLPELRGAGLD